jgi:hypothetical protein
MHWTLLLSCAQIVRSAPSLLPSFPVDAYWNCSTFNCLTILYSWCQHIYPRQIKQAASATPFASDRIGRTNLYAQWHSSAPSWKKDALDVRHDRLFFNTRRPDSLVTLDTFKGFITRSLRDAGIDAPPGSTPATTASSALGRGAAIGDILRKGNWSASSTFLRHYASL